MEAPGGSYADFSFDKAIQELGVLTAENENDKCMDCGRKDPDWVSIDFGLFICLQCCGLHRSWGTHITRVKSLKLDSWKGLTVEQKYLTEGGNKRFKDYITSLGAEVHEHRDGTEGTRVRSQSGVNWGNSSKDLYMSQEVMYYREMLLARVEDRSPVGLYEFLQQSLTTRDGDDDESSSEDSDLDNYVLEDDEEDISNINSDSSNCKGKGKNKKKSGGAAGASSSNVFMEGSLKSTKEGSAPWVPDVVCNRCMICNRDFNLMKRKHHCRNCGKCVCVNCAPAKNTKPITRMGLRQPVRTLLYYCSSFLIFFVMSLSPLSIYCCLFAFFDTKWRLTIILISQSIINTHILATSGTALPGMLSITCSRLEDGG
jgi:hypothetical protein